MRMHTAQTAKTLSHLFSELTNGVRPSGGFILNTGDAGLLASLDKISAADASHSVNDGATIAAHTRHVQYGLSLMNRWATEGGNPFANAKWDEAWKTTTVDDTGWQEIRTGLKSEATRWLEVLKTPREVAGIEFSGMVGSIAHLAYHLGAIRQINKTARGPKEGTF